MANKKSTSKSTKVTATKHNTKVAPTKPKTTKTTRAKRRTQKPEERTRFIACIIGAVAAVILIVILVIGLAHSISENGKNSLTVKDGDGNKIATQYLGFANYNFQLKIPTGFKSLTEAEIKSRYKSVVPEIVYASTDNVVNIAIYPSNTKMKNSEIKDYYLNAKNTLAMNGSEILSDNYYSVAKHNVGQVVFVNNSTRGLLYNNQISFSQDDKLTIVTFNCDDNVRKKWEPVAKFVIKSLDFTK